MLGEHQAANASLALAVLEHLANEGSLGVRMPEAVGALKSAFLPARMQLLGRAPIVLLDGAHNVHGAIALVSFLGPRLKGSHPACIVGMSKGKDVSAMLKCLYRLNPAFVFPEVDHDRLLSAQRSQRRPRGWACPFGLLQQSMTRSSSSMVNNRYSLRGRFTLPVRYSRR